MGRFCRFVAASFITLAVIGCNDNKLGSAGGPDIAVSPESLEFTAAAFQGGGGQASLTVIISNEGKGPLELADIKFTPNTSTELSWQFGGGSTLPLNLAPAGWVAVQVVYAPTDYVQDGGSLLIFSNDPDEDVVEVPIVTPLLGPQLGCEPNPAVFLQAPGTPTTRTISCSNVGTSPITLTGMEFAAGTSAEFTATFPVTPVTLDAGDVLPPFNVTYTPAELGTDAGQILVHNDTGTDYVIELNGEGTDQPLCDISAFPFWVDFGSVLLGTTSTKTVLLNNNGTGTCNVTAIGVNSPFTTEFSYTGPQTYTINPGGSQLVSVQYTPVDRIPDIFAFLEVTNDDPAEPLLGVPLSGKGAGPEVDVLPCPVEFGQVTVGCKVDRQVTIYNTGDLALTLSGVTVASGGPEFSVVGTPPTSVPVNGTATVNVRLAPTSAGAKSGILRINSNDGDEPVFQCILQGSGTNDDHQVDQFTQTDEPMADILFVVDNSGSMSDEQQTLANSFPDFANYLVGQNVSYQVGVTTTDIDMFTGQHGELVGSPNIIMNSTPNAAAEFASNANVGTNGDASEQGLEAARLALTPPNITGANAGFLRQAAKLFLIFVSDEEDQSPDGNASQPTSYFVNAFRNIKNNDPALLSASAIAGDVPNGCATAAAGARYKEVVDAIGGVWSTICTSNFGPALHNIGVEAAELQSTFYLSREPIPATIQVRVNNVMQPAANYTYNATPNSITFVNAAIPDPGDIIRIEYDVVCQMP